MRTLYLVLVLLLLGCTTAPTATPDPRTITLPPSIGAHTDLNIPLPAGGTPEANPTMTLMVALFDNATGEPVVGDIYWVKAMTWREPTVEELRGADVHAVDIMLPGEMRGWLVVLADGYQLWKLEVRYNTRTSREMEVPVGLTRATGEEI